MSPTTDESTTTPGAFHKSKLVWNRVAWDVTSRMVGYTYDASGRLWRVTDPAGGVTEYTYDTSYRMLTLKVDFVDW